MKHYPTTLLAVFAIWYYSATPLRAQDGYLFSAQPPVVVRLGAGTDHMIYFTNTSDNVIHGITVNHTDDKGSKTTKIVIDTIDAHKTVTIELYLAFELTLDDSAITCTHYSKPLPVKLKLE